MRDTIEAFKFLFVGPAIVMLAAVINFMTSPGDWWVQWVAFGIGIAWVICLFRVVTAALLTGGLVAAAALLRHR